MKNKIEAFILLTSLFLWSNSSFSQSSHLILDINEGYEDSYVYPKDKPFEILNDNYFFIAYNKEHDEEIWKYDGDTATLLKDINPNGGSNLDQFYVLNNRLLFLADDGIHGSEWWITTGTSEDTRLLIDLNPGIADGVTNCCNKEGMRSFIIYKNELYFNVNKENGEFAIFKTDGTLEGTKELKLTNEKATTFRIFNDLLYFSVGNKGLWITDGTAENTNSLIDESFEDHLFDPIIIYSNESYLFILTKEENKLFSSKGSIESTKLLKDFFHYKDSAFINQGNFFIDYQDKVIFPAAIDSNNVELWKSDGTAEGTLEVLDLEADDANNPIIPRRKILFKDNIYYIGGNQETNRQIFKTDGTVEGTEQITDLHNFVEKEEVWLRSELLATENHLFLVGGKIWDLELWYTEGNQSSLKEINIDMFAGSTPVQLSLFKNKLICFAESYSLDDSESVGHELHYIDLNFSLPSHSIEIEIENINIYPNPAENEILISTEFSFDQLKILNSSGLELMRLDNHTQIEISSLINGIYILELINTKTSVKQRKKFIIQR